MIYCLNGIVPLALSSDMLDMNSFFRLQLCTGNPLLMVAQMVLQMVLQMSCLVPECLHHCLQGRQKQSADGQAQFDVGGEAGNNSRAKRVAKFRT